ncbi:peptidase M23-like protein [Frigoribacterium sp. PhB107]|uniref:M23 family metallopeptidase n=1 Tax=Frigoribacterium sp. PhB107 TaxID=2485172 RepID=UPI000FA4580E|nr:M23 family metallopeptidase [Frigoribacterium sp. PhB107]ROP78315.1 peptidase M23-like protein [Frigoribacterium sp. PhB107]
MIAQPCGLTQERTEIPISGPYGTVVWPVDPHPAPDSRYGQQYGAPRSYGSHTGCDYVVDPNTPIRAIADGTVTESRTLNGAAGNCVGIDHGGFSSRYLHMIRPPSVPLGARVSAGDVIGYVGSTGSSSVNHLHIDVRLNGATTDPHVFFQQYVGPGSTPTTPTKKAPKNMLLISSTQNLDGAAAGYVAVVGVRTLRHVTTIEQLDALRTAGLELKQLTRDQFYNVINGLSIPRAAISDNADYAR